MEKNRGQKSLYKNVRNLAKVTNAIYDFLVCVLNLTQNLVKRRQFFWVDIVYWTTGFEVAVNSSIYCIPKFDKNIQKCLKISLFTTDFFDAVTLYVKNQQYM